MFENILKICNYRTIKNAPKTFAVCCACHFTSFVVEMRVDTKGEEGHIETFQCNLLMDYVCSILYSAMNVYMVLYVCGCRY